MNLVKFLSPFLFFYSKEWYTEPNNERTMLFFEYIFLFLPKFKLHIYGISLWYQLYVLLSMFATTSSFV